MTDSPALGNDNGLTVIRKSYAHHVVNFVAKNELHVELIGLQAENKWNKVSILIYSAIEYMVFGSKFTPVDHQRH